MNETMSQPTVSQDPSNEQAWADGGNWYLFTTIYASRQDRRLIVPRRRGYGATVNFGHGGAVPLLAGVVLAPVALVLTALALFGR